MQIIIPNGDQAGIILDGEPQELIDYMMALIKTVSTNKDITIPFGDDTNDYFKKLFGMGQ